MSHVNNHNASATKVYRVCVDHRVYQKLFAYIRAVDTEISGLGLVSMQTFDDGADFIIEDLFLLDQECTVSQTTLDPNAIGELMIQLIQQGVDLGKLKLWWHSHQKMTVFWSGTDNGTISQLGQEWMLSIVGNHRGQILARVDIYKPFPVTIHQIQIVPVGAVDLEMENEVAREVSEKVTQMYMPPVRLRRPVYSNNGYSDTYEDEGAMDDDYDTPTYYYGN